MYEKDDVYVITRPMKLFFDTLKTPITPFCTKIKKDQRFQTINFTIWSGTSIMQILIHVKHCKYFNQQRWAIKPACLSKTQTTISTVWNRFTAFNVASFSFVFLEEPIRDLQTPSVWGMYIPLLHNYCIMDKASGFPLITSFHVMSPHINDTKRFILSYKFYINRLPINFCNFNMAKK